MEQNGYTRFGKYLLAHLGVVEDPDALDWAYIIKEFTLLSVKKKPGLMYINWVVATHFNMEPQEIRLVKTNKRSYSTPKHVAMYLANILFGHNQYDIRDFYTIQNRSSVSNAITKVEEWLATDKHFRIDLEQITNKLLGYEQIYHEPFKSATGCLVTVPHTRVSAGNCVLVNGNGEI